MRTMNSEESKKKNRSGRTTALQLEELVKYMETHSEFASNKFLTKDGRVHQNQQWAELGKMLNELTKGPGKTVKQWQTVWRDIKSNTSKKASKLRNEKNRTGNFPINAEPLDNLEQHVIACMGLEYVQGASNVPDSTPEEEEYQIQLENGNENVLQIPPTTTSIGDYIHVEDVRQNNINNDYVGLTVPEEEDVNDELSYEDVLSSFTDQRNIVHEENATKRNERINRTLSNSNDKRNRGSFQNRKSKERISVQLQKARDKFSQIAESHAGALQVLAEASMKQADASLLRAQTEEKRLQFEERRLTLEERKIRTDEQFIQVMHNLQTVLDELLHK